MITKKFGVRDSLTAFLNNFSFNHRNHDIKFNLMLLKIYSFFLLCWGLEFMKLKNMVLLQLHLAPPVLGDVISCTRKRLCNECHPFSGHPTVINIFPEVLSDTRFFIMQGFLRNGIFAFYLIQFLKFGDIIYH